MFKLFSMAEIEKIYVRIIGPRPPFGQVANELWGPHIDFDSDGNSASAKDPNWTELTVTRRPDYDERVDIDSIDGQPDVLVIQSESQDLAEKVRDFLIQFGAVEVV